MDHSENVFSITQNACQHSTPCYHLRRAVRQTPFIYKKKSCSLCSYLSFLCMLLIYGSVFFFIRHALYILATNHLAMIMFPIFIFRWPRGRIFPNHPNVRYPLSLSHCLCLSLSVCLSSLSLSLSLSLSVCLSIILLKCISVCTCTKCHFWLSTCMYTKHETITLQS